MKHTWEDVTSYTQSKPRGAVEPRTWQLKNEKGPTLRVIVTRKMHYGDDAWFLFCPRLDLDVRLGALDLKAAQIEAVVVVQRALAKWSSELPRYR